MELTAGLHFFKHCLLVSFLSLLFVPPPSFPSSLLPHLPHGAALRPLVFGPVESHKVPLKRQTTGRKKDPDEEEKVGGSQSREEQRGESLVEPRGPERHSPFNFPQTFSHSCRLCLNTRKGDTREHEVIMERVVWRAVATFSPSGEHPRPERRTAGVERHRVRPAGPVDKTVSAFPPAVGQTPPPCPAWKARSG